MKIVIACDHAGFELKEFLKEAFADRVEWLDLGTDSTDSVDYPDYAQALAKVIMTGEADRGVLICGTGIGISIAANRYPAVRAALCHNSTEARLTRLHNDANVLALGARIIGQEVARDCLEAFMTTIYEAGRHDKRVKKLSKTD